MSFGASPSDIIIVVTFCRALYRKCRTAGGEYDEISREVRGLHTVLKHLKYEVEAPESPLNRDHSLWGRQLAPIIGDCDFTLRQLDELLQKYGRLGSGGSSPSSPSSVRVLWERMKFGTNEMDTLGEIRVKMISHKTSLTLFLDTIQLHQTGKMSKKLDSHQNHLDVILDKVDNIAARMGANREGSVMTSYEDDDKEVWKQFRRELVAEGFSSDVLQQHKDVLRAYIREIDQNGLLEEPRTPTPPMLSSEQWVDSVHSAISEDAPPSFNSLGASTDSSTKELMIREDNMKFPQSIKLELRQPESRGMGLELSQSKPDVPVAEDRAVNNSQVRPILIPISSQLLASDEKEVLYQNTDGSSSDEESYHGSSSEGAIIRTSDLLALTRALQLHVPGSSPSASFRSSIGSIAGEEPLRVMALRPEKQVESGSSPSQIDGSATPSSTLRLNNFGTSPRPDNMHKLAPDQHGNEIPPDAMWTKINRSLVSPQVLHQDGKRYEARPEFVAVLGVLSRAEIEALAARSQALRASRRQRSMPSQEREVPPPQPPRPTPVQQPSFSFNSASRAQDGHDTSSSSSHFSSESESDSDYEHRRRRRTEDHKRTSGSIPISTKRHPSSYGTLPLPMLNARPPNSTAQQAIYMSGGLGVGDVRQSGQPQGRSYNYNPSPRSQPQAEGWGPPPLNQRPSQHSTQQYPVRNHHESERENNNRDRNRERERNERERDQRRRYSNHDGTREHSNHTRRNNNNQNLKQAKHSRWKENLASAGIGGAAATLLNVLTEAAEAL